MTRTRAAVASLIAWVAVTLGLACSELRRGFGEDCLKNDDCLSNVCSSQKCSSAPTLLPPGVVNSSNDASADAPSDAPVANEAGPDGDVRDANVPDTTVADAPAD